MSNLTIVLALTFINSQSPTTVGSAQVAVSLPAGTKCTGGTAGNLCLVSFTTAGGFGNCVAVAQGAAAGTAAAGTAATGAAATGTTAAGTAATGAKKHKHKQGAAAAAQANAAKAAKGARAYVSDSKALRGSLANIYSFRELVLHGLSVMPRKTGRKDIMDVSWLSSICCILVQC